MDTNENQEPTINKSAWLQLTLQMFADSLQRALLGTQTKANDKLRILVMAVDSREMPVDIITVATNSSDELMEVLTKTVTEGLEAYAESPHKTKN